MLELLIQYKYVAFFVGMVIGGDLVLITGVYLAMRGHLEIVNLIVIAYSATTISDLIWYFVGTKLTEERLASFKLIRIKKSFIDTLKNFYRRHGLKTLFYSKFIYGTRTVAQILGGVYSLPIVRYTAVNSVGTITYTLIIVFLCYLLKFSIDDMHNIIENAQITLLVFVVVIFLINTAIRQAIKKKMLRENETT